MSGNAAGYGSHPTPYSGLSDTALYARFYGESWAKAGEQERLGLLQEAVNRSAQQHGELGSCRVEFADLGPTTAGQQSGDLIQLNREMYVNDRKSVVYEGQLHTMPLQASGLSALTTAFHEDEHAYQNQMIRGEIPGDPNQVREYAANNFSVVAVEDQNGAFRPGCTYLQGSTPGVGYYAYYFQSTERDAHLFSEAKTAQIMASLSAQLGDHPDFEAYRQELAANGYQATLAEAQALFQNPNLEHDINQCILNHYYGTNEPVDPQVEALVKAEMTQTYTALTQGRNAEQHQEQSQAAQAAQPGQEEQNMGINWEVHQEEYDAGLQETAGEFIGTQETENTAQTEAPAVEAGGNSADLSGDEGLGAPDGGLDSSDGVDAGDGGGPDGVDGGDGGVDDDGGIE